MPFFKRRKSSTSKELEINIQKRVEELEKTVAELQHRLEILTRGHPSWCCFATLKRRLSQHALF